MNEIGIDNFYIELYVKYSCDSKEELFRKEGEIIRELKPVLNNLFTTKFKVEPYKSGQKTIKNI